MYLLYTTALQSGNHRISVYKKKKKIRIKDYFSLYLNKKKSKGVNWDVNAKLTKSPSH